MTSRLDARPASSGVRRRTPVVDFRRQFARRALVSDVLVTLLWASGAAAAALYLAYGGASQFGSVGAAITSLGILAGLIGSDFILVMLVLAARVPVIDRAVGHDRAIALHRSLGKPALYLILIHGLLLLVGYGISSGINPIVEIGPMLALPDMPLAFIGTGLLIGVVVTSLVAVRRKFSYEGWHLVHLLSYVAVAFALPHQFSVGGMLAQGTGQRIYWIALYVLAFGAIGLFRFAEPVISSLRHRLRVSRLIQLAPGVVSIEFSGRQLRALETAGGQFLIWRFWTARTWWHSHPISLSAMPSDGLARITVRDLGAGSARISQIPVGTRVSFEGPYGLFSQAARTKPNLAIVAAGIGVTPVRALLEQADRRSGDITILLRGGSDDETYLWDEIEDIASAKGATLYTMVGPRSRRAPTWMTATDAARGVTLRSTFPRLANSDLYLCGPTAWLDEVEADARAFGLSEEQIHSERFDW